MNEARQQKRGRPRGLSPILTVTVSAATLARIDAVAASHFENRRAAARRLLDAGLAVEAQRSPLARSRGRA
jgi:hypothetical protein